LPTSTKAWVDFSKTSLRRRVAPLVGAQATMSVSEGRKGGDAKKCQVDYSQGINGRAFRATSRKIPSENPVKKSAFKGKK